jgi:L-asparaginase
MKKRKLLFITTGGTIASVQTESGLVPLLSSGELLQQLPELAELCIPDTLSLCSIDSTDITPDIWLALADALRENYTRYDGFIICHGTDTMGYTAAALSYLVQNADKPIVLTGAQQPISGEITDAKKNLRDSVICAIDPASRGIMVVFGGKVIAGTRAKKNKTISYDAFASVNFPALAQVQGDKLVRYIPTPYPSAPVVFYDALSPRVFLLKLTPGMSPDLIPEIFRLYDCVIIESFGVGGIPKNLMDAFAACLGDYEKTHKVLVLTTQVTYEGSDVGIYEVGKRVRERFETLEAHDMTIEAVYTKCMWLLAQNCRSFAELEQRFYGSVNFDTFFQ